jgi:hypothetical protein
MRKLFNFIAIMILFVVTAFPAYASVVKSGFDAQPDDNLTSTNSVKIRCFVGDEKVNQSVAAVLDINAFGKSFKKKDVALTTGHGLPLENLTELKKCFVYGPTGRAYKIRAVRTARDYAPGTSTDWALILFDRIRDETLVRYSIANDLSINDFEKLAGAKTDVQFATARGIQINGQNCNLVPRRYAKLSGDQFAGVVAHSCRAISGQSGSPVSVSNGNQEILLGIHLGKLFTLPIRNVTTKARWVGFMRVIDQSLLTTFQTMIDDLDKEF